MKLRIVHTQTLLLLSAVLLTVLCMGALNAWNLRNGFSEFLVSRDTERLENFANLVGARAEKAGGINALIAQGVDLENLFREFGQKQNPNAVKTLIPKISTDKNNSLFSPPPHPTTSIDAFKERVAIYNNSGQLILGSSVQSSSEPIITRPIDVKGEVIAQVHMIQLKPVPDDIESKFLTSQYQSILIVSGALLFIAFLLARWVARQWVQPLLEIQNFTKRIANGAFDNRLIDHRSDEIGDAMRNINQMAESLQKLETSRRRWIADMSHELRTPLTILRGEIDALVDGIIPTKTAALISLQEEVLHLNALVDDLHLLAMSDLRALPCYFEEIDALELVENLLERFSLRVEQENISLIFENRPAHSITVHWDKKRIEQLLGNLLDNSLRYTDAPGKIIFNLSQHEQNVMIQIQDTPPGLSHSDFDRIFEPLFRADLSRSRQSGGGGGGSGLGLAICQQIVQAHHGHISAAASVLGGVQLTIELPIALANKQNFQS